VGGKKNTGSYTNDERDSYKEIIFSNTIQSMHVILDAMQLMQIELKDPSLIPVGQMIQSLPSQLDKTYLDPHVVTAIRQLWQDPGVRKCFERSREYQLSRYPLLFFFIPFLPWQTIQILTSHARASG
jgi:guanine nucleotide-binding protein subunit alpha